MSTAPLREELLKIKKRDVSPEPVSFAAADGYRLKGTVWRHCDDASGTRPIVVINAATSVRCRYYARFASFLHDHGFDVLTYDYRGIGESRPPSLRGFPASWTDWGQHDFEGALRYVAKAFPGQPIHVVGHSIGGFVIGLAPSSHLICRVFTMGAQYAFKGDYAAGAKLRMLAKWHVAMPLLTAVFGYFPGKRLSWLEDTPKGVVYDWSFSQERFEDSLAHRLSAAGLDRETVVRRFAAVTAPILAISVTDDEFGTIAAIERLLAYFSGSQRTHLRLAPASIDERAIGHFGFFHSRFEQTLWRLPLEWLARGELPVGYPGVLIEGKTDAQRQVNRG